MNSVLTEETTKGMQIVLCKSTLSKHKISGLRTAEITDVHRKTDDMGKVEMRFTAKLLLPRTAKTCTLCGSPTRVNNTTGEAVCKDHQACGHRHGFIQHPQGVVLGPLTREDFSPMQSPE
jgi:hypothetical protein